MNLVCDIVLQGMECKFSFINLVQNYVTMNCVDMVEFVKIIFSKIR